MILVDAQMKTQRNLGYMEIKNAKKKALPRQRVKNKMIDKIEVPIMYYIDDETNERVYDFEEMANEFENKISRITKVSVMCSIVEGDPIVMCSTARCINDSRDDELYGELNKIHVGDESYLNKLFNEDDLLCDSCLSARYSCLSDRFKIEVE